MLLLNLSVISRPVAGTCLIVTTALLLIYMIEYDNPVTLGKLDESGKWVASWFQAVTPHTAGFNTLDIAALRDGTTFAEIPLQPFLKKQFVRKPSQRPD